MTMDSLLFLSAFSLNFVSTNLRCKIEFGFSHGGFQHTAARHNSIFYIFIIIIIVEATLLLKGKK